MSVSEAADQLLQIIDEFRQNGTRDIDLAYTENSLVVGVARVGHESQKLVACTMAEMKNADLGPPLHTLILPSKKLHPLEIEYLQQFSEKNLSKKL
jgi:diphthine methyl ester synthase